MHFKGRQKLTPEQLLDPPASARGWFSWLDQSEFPNTTKTWRKIRIWDKQVQKRGDEVHRNPYSHRWWTRGCFFFLFAWCCFLFFFCNFLSRWSFALRLSNFQTSPSGRSLFLPPRVRGGSQFLYVDSDPNVGRSTSETTSSHLYFRIGIGSSPNLFWISWLFGKWFITSSQSFLGFLCTKFKQR